MRLLRLVLVLFAVASCGGPATTDVSLPSTTPATNTTVPVPTSLASTTTSAATLPPELPPPSITAPEVRPKARKAVEPCNEPDDVHYCIWGTMPVDLTINNSRRAVFTSSARQTFVALAEDLSLVQLSLGVAGAGGLTTAEPNAVASSVCVSVSISTETGLELVRTDLVPSDSRGVIENVTIPLATGMLPGAVHALTITAKSGCIGRKMVTMVAMSSDWKYPAASGRLDVDGRRSIGSLWARVD